MFNTPILFLIFNRPDLAQITFASICKIKPKKLYIAADGPRSGNQYDELNCMITRQSILSMIDWECEIQTLFQVNNLGCGVAVSGAINWFFSQVEKGIIIEDDCQPNISFFSFCEELLERYEFNEKITHISGTNHQYRIPRGYGDYYFSCNFNVWGWATWRRAWKIYDFKMDNLLVTLCDHPDSKLIPEKLFLDVYHNKIDTWDIQWHYINFKINNLSVIPNINLIKNLGFNKNATHTIGKIPEYIVYSGLGDFKLRIKHPREIKRSKNADLFTAMFMYKTVKPSFFRRLERKLSMLIQKKMNKKFIINPDFIK
jgi:hypothetical protein